MNKARPTLNSYTHLFDCCGNYLARARRRSTGRKNPTMPGSKRQGEERISTTAGICIGELARTAARRRSQPRNRINNRVAKPDTHKRRIAKEVQLIAWVAEGAETRVLENGRTTCATSNDIIGGAIPVAIFLATIAPHRLLPSLISGANGTRNLTDALSHNQ